MHRPRAPGGRDKCFFYFIFMIPCIVTLLLRSNKMHQYAGIYLLQNYSTYFGSLHLVGSHSYNFSTSCPYICGSPIRNLLYVTFLTLPGVKLHIDFWKISLPLVYTKQVTKLTELSRLHCTVFTIITGNISVSHSEGACFESWNTGYDS